MISLAPATMSGKNSQNIDKGFQFRNIKKQRQKKNKKIEKKHFLVKSPRGEGRGTGLKKIAK